MIPATMVEFRQMHENGIAEVQRSLAEKRCTEEQAQAAFEEYRVAFGIMDSMTTAEKDDPLKSIDSQGIMRLAHSAGTTDQNVIQFLISWHNFQEMIARTNARLAEDSDG